jgi:hypothetical protein
MSSNHRGKTLEHAPPGMIELQVQALKKKKRKLEAILAERECDAEARKEARLLLHMGALSSRTLLGAAARSQATMDQISQANLEFNRLFDEFNSKSSLVVPKAFRAEATRLAQAKLVAISAVCLVNKTSAGTTAKRIAEQHRESIAVVSALLSRRTDKELLATKHSETKTSVAKLEVLFLEEFPLLNLQNLAISVRILRRQLPFLRDLLRWADFEYQNGNSKPSQVLRLQAKLGVGSVSEHELESV